MIMDKRVQIQHEQLQSPHGAHRLTIKHGDSQFSDYLMNLIQIDFEDRQTFQGYNSVGSLRLIGYDTFPNNTLLYMAGSLAIWQAIVKLKVGIPIVEYLLMMGDVFGKDISSITIESHPVIYSDPTGRTVLPFAIYRTSEIAKQVHIKGPLSLNQLQGIAQCIAAACRQNEWMAGRVPTGLTLEIKDGIITLPTPLRDEVLLQAIGTGMSLYWAPITQVSW